MDLWGCNKKEVLQVCKELCVKTKRRGRSGKHMVVERASKRYAIDQKKKAFKLWCIDQWIVKIITGRPEMKRRK